MKHLKRITHPVKANIEDQAWAALLAFALSRLPAVGEWADQKKGL